MVEFLSNPKNVAITAYVAMIVGMINTVLMFRTEYKKRPSLILETPKPELNCFCLSDNPSTPNGYLIAFVQLTNTSSLPLHVNLFELHNHEQVGVFDSLSPIYSYFDLNAIEQITFGPESNILRPNVKIEPYSSVQGFIYFEAVALSDAKFELFVYTPRKTFKSILTANKVI